MQSLVIRITSNNSSTVLAVLDAFKQHGKKVSFARSAEHLDIDTPNKDSYALFKAGLDFIMLATDKQHYLKSRQDVSNYWPLLDDIDWVIQDGEVYTTDVILTISGEEIINEQSDVFSLQDPSTLINWLEKQHEQKQ